MTYNSGQLSVLFDCLPKTPKWLIVGGPTDADEAKTAVEKWQGIGCIGCEPNRQLYGWQLSNNWPIHHPLLPVALSNDIGSVMMKINDDNPRASSVMRERAGELYQIPTLTIDFLDLMYGPLEDVVLWLDVEGHEFEALEGAKELLSRKSVIAVNVEFLERLQKQGSMVDRLLVNHGFFLRKVWNKQAGLCEDRIYVCQK